MPCPEFPDVVKMERMIKGAHCKVKELLTKHRELKSKVNESHDPIVRRLPVEIISRIFELCLPDHTTSVHVLSGNLSSEFSPLYLGAVCKAWKSIAWSTPQLWTFIPVPLSSSLFTSSEAYNIVKEWFRRTGALPLSVKVYRRTVLEGEHRDLPTLEQVFPVISLINDYSSRWQTLDLSLPRVLIEKFKHRPREGFQPIFETLKLRVNDVNTIGAPYTVNMWDLSPIKVRISGIGYESLGIEWSNLTTLVAFNLYSDEILKILTNGPQTTDCTFRSVQYRRPELVPRP